MVEKDQSKAVKGAKIIQENGPENIEFKQNLYKNLEEYADEEAFFNFFIFYTSIYYF
ncbi:hypothetical protein BU120_12690 [Staphylococcus xylosus]|nr:hypothetical protein BU120_12690 [Staphylococcus xylosus]PTK90848.1 hypothetical protein BUZ05_10130 [Staphylococcus gallinarum]PTK92868.1 hypothetical protein BUZ13_07605 [Staphylococcus gallinarum]RIL48248.1 hypothetical protein BUY76_11010 [Staphylococcus equorum]RIO87583.1 hypothetical protein BUZ06_10305 [Staphylococcus gallinarum]